MDREGLAWIQDHTAQYTEIVDPDCDSQLIAHPSSVNIASLEKFQVAPNRIKRNLDLLSCNSFCDYVNRFKEEDTSVYLDANGGRFLAVLDHHGPDKPQWTGHNVRFVPKRSIEWGQWTRVHGEKLTQLELAEFIELNLNDIKTPEPNVMLQAALAFEANEKLTLASSINLDDGGTRFNFTKENVNKSVTFPHRIQIEIPVYENDKPRVLDVRIRYKADSDGVLTFTLWMADSAQRIERDELIGIADRIAKLVAGIHIYEGAADFSR